MLFKLSHSFSIKIIFVESISIDLCGYVQHFLHTIYKDFQFIYTFQSSTNI